MYDMAVDLESYLRNNFTYSTTIQQPQGAEATAWLLFQSNHRFLQLLRDGDGGDGARAGCASSRGDRRKKIKE